MRAPVSGIGPFKRYIGAVTEVFSDIDPKGVI